CAETPVATSWEFCPIVGERGWPVQAICANGHTHLFQRPADRMRAFGCCRIERAATWRPAHGEITMATELLVLALAAVLLVVHIMLAGHFRTRQYGTEWNMGARDAE